MTDVIQALTEDRGLQAIMASEFKVRGIDAGIPTTALQACIVHVAEAFATLSQQPQAEGLLSDIVSEAVFLLDRLDEVERDFTDNEETRDYFGHCCPPKARLRRLLDTHLKEQTDEQG